MRDLVDRVMSACLTVAAVTIAVTFAHREFVHRVDSPAAQQSPKYVAGWTKLLDAGVSIGDTAAPIKLIEFGDFECPFCRHADSTYGLLRQKLGARFAIVFVHFPLAMHRFALPAARAAE